MNPAPIYTHPYVWFNTPYYVEYTENLGRYP